MFAPQYREYKFKVLIKYGNENNLLKVAVSGHQIPQLVAVQIKFYWVKNIQMNGD